MKLKAKCCKKIQKKGEACRKCPLAAALSDKKLKKHLAKAKKRLNRAA